VNSATAERLVELNRRFYTERGQDFSETRRRVQPGVRRVLERLRGDESILDLGCGNGAFAGELSRRAHRGSYLGLDFSTPLLEDARRASYSFPVRFAPADLVSSAKAGLTAAAAPPNPDLPHSNQPGIQSLKALTDRWALVTAFAVLHHIPGADLRSALIAQVRACLKPDGLFIHSNWQFTSSSRLRARIRPWSDAGLEGSVDEGDYLLEWRRGGSAMRYVHEFRQDELAGLAAASGFAVVDTFYSDGADRRSGIYQVWQPA
jgi:SAM-dependent methyltransferase